MTSTSSALVNACGPVSGIFWPTSSSVQQCLRRHRRDVAVDDGRGRRRRVRPADHVAGLDLRRPHAEEVGDEHRRPQAHPFQTGVDGELLHLLVAVAAEPRRLAREVVVGVDRRQRDEPRDAFAGAPVRTTAASSSPSARELRNTADAPGRPAAAEPTTSTPAGNSAASGCRVTARTSTPAAASCLTSGRPTLPVAPVTRIAFMQPRTARRPEKLHAGRCNFSRR